MIANVLHLWLLWHISLSIAWSVLVTTPPPLTLITTPHHLALPPHSLTLCTSHFLHICGCRYRVCLLLFRLYDISFHTCFTCIYIVYL